MQLNTVRLVNGPSLFASVPCVLATLSDAGTNVPGQAAYAQAARDWPALAEQLDATASPDRDGLPGAAQLVCLIVSHCLAQTSLPEDKISLRHEPAQHKIFIAVPQQNTALTSELVTRCCHYVLALFLGQNHQPLRDGLKDFLGNTGALAKKSAIADMQRHLVRGNIPWLALDWRRENKDLLQLGFGRQQRLILRTTGTGTTQIGADISMSKRRSQHFLAEAGFPVPRQARVNSLQHALQLAHRFGYPVVLKAEHGTKGERVFADLRSDEELSRSFQRLMTIIQPIRHATSVLLEQHVPGRVYRVEVMNGAFFDAYDMIPAAVHGDGQSTVRQLIETENRQPNRQDKGHLKAKYCALKLGPAEQLMLQKQQLTPASIPPAGQEVRLSANSNWSAGGTFKRVSDTVHPDNIRLAEQVAAGLNVDMLGIDLITHDIGRSFTQEPLTIIEVNHQPYIASYTDDETGETLDNGPRLLERLAGDLSYGETPVIVITADDSSCALSDAVTAQLIVRGNSPARLCDHLVEVNGMPAGTVNPEATADPALILLRRPDAGAFVMERTLADIADFGIGSGGVDVAVISAAADDTVTSRAWPDGIDSNALKQLLIDQARVGVILVASQAQDLALCEALPAGRSVVIATNPQLGERWVRNDVELIICDEAQHNPAPDQALPGRVAQALSSLLAKGPRR